MSFAGLKGILQGNGNSVANPTTATGSVAVVVGDLVFVVFGQQTNLTAGTVTDNLGNTYSALNAGTDAGNVTGRPYYSRVTVAGTLTTISVTATASNNDYAVLAAVVEGPLELISLDANIANITSDVVSPFTAPSPGTLGQDTEILIGWGVADQSTAWVATSPNLLAGNVANSNSVKVAIGYQATSSVTPTAPAFTAASNPSQAVLGTASFRSAKVSARADLVLTKDAPTVTLQINTDLSPARRDLVLSTTAPVLTIFTTTANLSPPAANLVLSAQNLTFKVIPENLYPASANLTLTKFAPTIAIEALPERLLWPYPILGAAIRAEGYSNRRADYGVRTEMESGFARVRTRERNPLRMINATFLFNKDQVGYFNAWFEYEARDSETWFQIELPIDGEARTVLARIMGEPRQTPPVATGEYWNVGLNLEVRDLNVISRETFAADYPDDGAFPLTTKAQFDGYGHERQPSGSLSDSGLDGVPRFRERIGSPFRRINLSWLLTSSEMQVFNAWLEYRARNQSGFWTVTLNIDGADRTFKSRFLEPPVVSSARDKWMVSAQIEARDVNYWSRADYDTYSTEDWLVLFDVQEMLEVVLSIQDVNLSAPMDEFFDAWDDADDYVWPG